MTIFRKILATTALCLAAAGLSSCIYSDLGRTVGSIGTEVPRLVPKANRGIMSSYCGNLYRKNGRYYVALPLAWVPERRRGYEIMLPFTPLGTSVFNTSHTYNRPYTAEELQQYPTKPEYYEAVNPSIVHFPQADANGAIGYVRADLTPAAEFNPEGAESIGLYGVAGAAHRIGHLEKRHAWYHYPLKPLQAVAAVADVPLSAALMPISFALLSMAMEVTGGDWQTIRPWHDNTRLTYDGPCIRNMIPAFRPLRPWQACVWFWEASVLIFCVMRLATAPTEERSIRADTRPPTQRAVPWLNYLKIRRVLVDPENGNYCLSRRTPVLP